MRNNRWSEGTPIEIERLGKRTAYRRIINGEFYQWKIKYGFTEVIGDYAIDNIDALDNAMCELKKTLQEYIMTETTFTARFFNEDGGRSNQTVAPYKELLVMTMKHLLLIFDDWDGFEIETNGKVIYKYLKNYGKQSK